MWYLKILYHVGDTAGRNYLPIKNPVLQVDRHSLSFFNSAYTRVGFHPSASQEPNRLSQRNSLKRGTKLHYCGELLQCKEPCQTIHHHSGIFSWGLLPPIAGQTHVANTCRLQQAWRVFSTIFTQLFTLNKSLLTFVHTAAVLGSYPAIQHYNYSMVQLPKVANDLAKTTKAYHPPVTMSFGLKPNNFR